jgi:hypothetical protein
MMEIVHKRYLLRYQMKMKIISEINEIEAGNFFRIQSMYGDLSDIFFTVKYVSRGENSFVTILVDRRKGDTQRRCV